MQSNAILSLTHQRWINSLARAVSRAEPKTSLAESHDLDAELARLVLLSEQRRLSILAPLLTGLTALVAIFGVVAHARGTLPNGYGWILLIACLACVYEWLASHLVMRLVKLGRQPARFRFYLNALVELGALAVMTLIGASSTNPVNAISGPASYSYFLFIILSTLRLDFQICLFTGVVAGLAYCITGVLHWRALEAGFSEGALTLQFSFFMRTLTFVLGGLAAGIVSERIRGLLVETLHTMRERERVKALFGQHVSPGVVNHLLARSHEEHSELRSVCVLVLDIRNFTNFAEKRSPDEVVAELNRLWSFMVRAVNEHHGFVNKFLGDGFLAVFGAPFSSGNDAQNAVAAARRILREFDEFKAFGSAPALEVGIAVHAGEAIVGNVGSAERKEYTVIGDVVNVAFRLEALNKNFGSRLLISEVVQQAAGLVGVNATAPIRIRGREDTVGVYRIA